MSKTKKSSIPVRHSRLGVMQDNVRAKAGPVEIRGTVKSLLCVAAGGLLVFFLYKKISNKSSLKKLDSETSANIMAYILKRKADAELFERKRAAYGKSTSDDDVTDAEENNTYVNEHDLIDWQTNYQSNCKKVVVSYPPIIQDYVIEAPKGFEEAVIAQLTAELAPCFSMVKARYLDGKMHRPNLFVVIEGDWGSGKSNFKAIHDTLFERRMRRDSEKLSQDSDKTRIIQTIPLSTSISRFIDVIAMNQGVHGVVMEPEIKTLVTAMKKSNGLGSEVLRKAFDNDEIMRLNKDKSAPQGYYKVALNFVITGTPGDTKDFIRKELEGGTTSRIAWCTIPPTGKDMPKFVLPEQWQLEALQDSIDLWTEQYSFKTDSDGNDFPVKETIINLDYVNASLKMWLDAQYEKAKEENNQAREHVRGRIGAIAFHSAIVYHMLYDNPTPKEQGKRNAVIALTLYMADYYMERFLHKFSKSHNEQWAKNLESEMVPNSNNSSSASEAVSSNPQWKSDVPEDMVKEWYEQFQNKGMGYKMIAKETVFSSDKVRSQIGIYARLHGLTLRTQKDS